MPFRMSGSVSKSGNFGVEGNLGAFKWSNMEAFFALETVMAQQGSSGCLRPGKGHAQLGAD